MIYCLWEEYDKLRRENSSLREERDTLRTEKGRPDMNLVQVITTWRETIELELTDEVTVEMERQEFFYCVLSAAVCPIAWRDDATWTGGQTYDTWLTAYTQAMEYFPNQEDLQAYVKRVARRCKDAFSDVYPFALTCERIERFLPDAA